MSYALLALELSEEIGNRPLRAVALNNLGWMYSNAGDQGRAIDCGQRALALLEETDEVGLRAHVLRTLGQSHHRAADHELASAELSAALAIFREQRDLYEEAYTLRWLAIMLRAAGNLAAARFAWQRSLPVLSDLGENLPPFDAFAREDDSTRR
jgi:tetratricopeptide (TPR) repeat protein